MLLLLRLLVFPLHCAEVSHLARLFLAFDLESAWLVFRIDAVLMLPMVLVAVQFVMSSHFGFVSLSPSSRLIALICSVFPLISQYLSLIHI